jgi:energy-coupling factor transport system permease protein
MLGGAALCCAGLALGSRRVTRSRYRPDPWLAPEWVVAACGIASAVVLFTTTGYHAADLNPSLYPLSWPPLPAVPTLGILLAAVAAVAAPPPRRPVRDRSTPARAQSPAEAAA